MADNFWDALEGKQTTSQPSQFTAAPQAEAAPQPQPEKRSAAKESFAPSASRVAKAAATAATTTQEAMPEVQAKSPVDDFIGNVMGLWQVPAGIAAYEVGRRAVKAVKERMSAPTLPPSETGIEPTFNAPVQTGSTAAPAPKATGPAPQIVQTASGPIDLNSIPAADREMIVRAQQATLAKQSGELQIPSLTKGPAPMTAPGVAPPAAQAAPAAVAAPAAAPVAAAPVAPAAAPAAKQVAGAVAPDKATAAMNNWVRGQMKQAGFTDLSDDAVNAYLRTFYGQAPITPGAGYAPEGYGERLKSWAMENIQGPGVGMSRAEKKALAAGVPPKQQGGASVGAMANTALNAAGGLMLLDMFKKAQQTGDYSDFALGAIGQVLGNVAPRGANVGYMLMQPNTVSSGTLDSPEAVEMMRRRNAGGGRGFVNPPMR